MSLDDRHDRPGSRKARLHAVTRPATSARPGDDLETAIEACRRARKLRMAKATLRPRPR